jgi:hypothetical protein
MQTGAGTGSTAGAKMPGRTVVYDQRRDQERRGKRAQDGTMANHLRLTIVCLAVLVSACATTSDEALSKREPWADVNVFVSPHPDDWQLFMNPEAFHSMDEPDERAVFVHVTAGDAGLGATGEPVPYFVAREEGAMRAIRFMANANPEPAAGRGVEMSRAAVERNGHELQRITYGNAVAYFLRLPDGNMDGSGYETTGWQSLLRLRTGAIAELQSVDASQSYAGWSDLVATLADIVRNEIRAGETLGLHFAEKDAELNPDDHLDHINAALAMESVAKEFPCASVHRYDEYITGERDVNVEGSDYLVDVGTWAATASGLSDSHAFSTWDSEHNSWLGRAYSRATFPKAGCPRSGE